MNKKCCICKRRKDLLDFSWRNKSKGIYSKECKECHRKIRKLYYKNNCEEEKDRILKRKLKIRKWLKEYKSVLKCNRCPENHIATLKFHHKNPKIKEISISTAVHKGWGIKRILKEIRKCEVLCGNCHDKEHYIKSGIG